MALKYKPKAKPKTKAPPPRPKISINAYEAQRKATLPPKSKGRPSTAYIPLSTGLVRAFSKTLGSGTATGRPQNAYVPVSPAFAAAAPKRHLPPPPAYSNYAGDSPAERAALAQSQLDRFRATAPDRWRGGDPRFRDMSIRERSMSGPAGWAYTTPWGSTAADLTPAAAAQIAALNAGEYPDYLPPAVAEILGISETDRRKYFEKYTDWSLLPEDQWPSGGDGGGGDGGDGGETPVTWTETYKVEGAPSWWKGLTPSAVTPESSYISLMNSLIPFLSEEDQRTVASNVSRMADAFAPYSPTIPQFAPPPNELTTELRNKFTSAARAGRVLETMKKMILSSGKEAKEYGPGYKYLQDVASVLRDFGQIGASDVQTRRQQLQALSALDPLLSEGEGEQLGAFGSIARALAQPFFSAGGLYRTQRTQGGKTVFGTPNAQWF